MAATLEGAIADRCWKRLREMREWQDARCNKCEIEEWLDGNEIAVVP
jgi:hypothetical protein